MRLVRRLDEAERARDKVFRDAAKQLYEAKERYQALQISKDLLGMEKARLNQKYVQALGSLEACKAEGWVLACDLNEVQGSLDKREVDFDRACRLADSYKGSLVELQGYVDDGKHILLAAGIAGVAWSALVYFLS